MILRYSIHFVTILAVAAGLSIICQAQERPLLTHHTREAALTGQAQFIKRLPATKSITLDIVLPLRNQAELSDFLREIYDPSSPSYRHFLSVKEFSAKYGPSQEDYDAVVRFAKTNGLMVVGGSRDGMDVEVSGSVAAIENAFHVAMGVYQHPTQNRTFYSPDREPKVNLPFRLWHISGLDSYSIPHPAMRHRNAVKSEIKAIKSEVAGSCPDNSYCGSDMRAAYYGGHSLTGSGQALGLLEPWGYDVEDVNRYFTSAGQINRVPLNGISTDGSSLSCLYAKGCDDTEQIIDITQAVSLAPGMRALNVYVGNSETAIFSAMSRHSPLDAQLSSSWTWSPADPATDDPYFEKFAAQGQSFFQAAGDGGGYTPYSEVVYPADDAYVTVVGGTDLLTKGGAWRSESAWPDGGGGPSPDSITIPPWQVLTGVITPTNMGSTTLRNSPDVAAEANYDFYLCSDQTTCTANYWGGTSFAAPIWAGYMALVNQQAIANGRSALGFINPTLYSLGLTRRWRADFHDIIKGGNGYPAVTGYDLATGWGSPNGTGLIDALAGTPIRAPRPRRTPRPRPTPKPTETRIPPPRPTPR